MRRREGTRPPSSERAVRNLSRFRHVPVVGVNPLLVSVLELDEEAFVVTVGDHGRHRRQEAPASLGDGVPRHRAAHILLFIEGPMGLACRNGCRLSLSCVHGGSVLRWRSSLPYGHAGGRRQPLPAGRRSRRPAARPPEPDPDDDASAVQARG